MGAQIQLHVQCLHLHWLRSVIEMPTLCPRLDISSSETAFLLCSTAPALALAPSLGPGPQAGPHDTLRGPPQMSSGTVVGHSLVSFELPR